MKMGLYTERGYTIEEAKQAMLGEIETWYGGATLDTFDCNVLGTMHRYECNEAAQLRMINGKVSNQPITLMCGQVPADPESDPVWGWLSHSAAECGKVHTAYTQFIASSAVRYQELKAQAEACTTVAEIDVMFHALWG
jgi:hypothetical protein